MGRDGEQEVSWKTTKGWKRDGESHPSGRSDVLEGGQPVAQVVCCDGQQAPSAEVGRWEGQVQSREIPISARNPLRWSLWDRLIRVI